MLPLLYGMKGTEIRELALTEHHLCVVSVDPGMGTEDCQRETAGIQSGRAGHDGSGKKYLVLELP